MDKITSDKQKNEDSKDFEKRMTDMVASGFATMGLAIGQALGLFTAMAMFDEPVTAKEIADKAECKERYIEEWLRLMVVSDIVELQDNKFFLPKHRIATVASRDSLTAYSIVLPSITSIHKDLLDCFKKSGPLGLPFSAHSHWFIPWKADKDDYYTQLMAANVSNIPGLCEKLEQGAQVCELGCGTGKSLIVMATMYPRSNFVGFDIDQECLAEAKSKIEEAELQNIEIIEKDCTSFADEYANHFDLLYMVDVLHDLAFPVKTLKEVYRALKPGCYISVDDMNVDSDLTKQKQANHTHQVYYMCSLYYCLPCSLQFEGSVGSGSCVGKQNLVRYIEEAGFKDVHTLEMTEYRNHAQIVGRKD